MDEVGRGSVFGPVAVGSVLILPEDQKNIMDPLWREKNSWLSMVDDSKKLSIQKREFLYPRILNTFKTHVSFVSASRIDQNNINEAIRMGVYRNFRYLERKYPNAVEAIVLDGNYRFSYEEELLRPMPAILSVVKGDQKCLSVALASIVAKVKRDALIRKMAVRFPGYGLEKNAGYGTKGHLNAIREKGLLPYHRKTFLKNI